MSSARDKLLPTILSRCRTLYLDLSPEQGMARAASVSPDGDHFEGGEELDFHHRVRHGFQRLALKYPDRIAQLDVTQPPKQVADAAWDAIQTRLTAR